MKTLPQISDEELFRFSSFLEDIRSFVQKHPRMSYIEFDYYVVHDITLFAVEPDFDFDKLQTSIEQIKKVKSAIKRIFAKPIIILIDNDDVVPAENARIITQKTLLHLANHSQYLPNLTKRNAKPRKLLTRVYEDDYCIYENVVFCDFIDQVLAIVKNNTRILNSLLYINNILQFNLLDKSNHVKYFLALGKLHTGYIRDFSRYYALAKVLLNDLVQIRKMIMPLLHKPLYQKNIKRRQVLSLKKTNIFITQKDYRQIYKTYKYLLNNQLFVLDKSVEIDGDELSRDYLLYVQMLTIFAAGHFNFEMTSRTAIDFRMLNVTMTYKGWKLDISANLKNEITLVFTKETVYKIMIVSNFSALIDKESYKSRYQVDEVVTVNQFHEDYLERDDIYLSMQDIDSFRRIQQILLRGMIYSDTKKDVCPFCGGHLIQESQGNAYVCPDCMTQIKQAVCPTTNAPYFYTDDTHLKKYAINQADFREDEEWYYKKRVESSLFFRNITKINNEADIICPHCHKVHRS